jgi:peptide/nickel transport system substrate-binding protein
MEVSGPLSIDIVTPEPFSRMAYGLAQYSYPIFDADVVASVEGDWGQLVPSLALAPVAKATPGVHLIVGPGGVNFVGLAVEPRILPFDDVRVRKALSLAIDNTAIAASVGQGIATPMKGWFPGGDPLEVDWVIFDPAQAESLLEEAGWLREGDGPRSKDGAALEARFYTYFDIGEGVATAAADMAARVGYSPTIRRFESYSEIQPVQSVDGGVYVVNTESYGLNGDPVGTMRNVVDPGYTTPGYPDWIALIEPVMSSSDKKAIVAALKAGQELNAEQAYWQPVMDYGTPYLVSDAYQTIQPNPFYLFVDWKTAPSS